jgi:O-antigen/teichoic acid export membrane protein
MKLRGLLGRAKALINTDGTVVQQSIASGTWMGMTNVLARGLQLLMVVILGRLLGPATFGIMGIALLIIGGMNRFLKLGIDSALIYNREENVDTYLNTVWVMKIARGVVIALIVVAITPLTASVLNEPTVETILPVMALSPLLTGLCNPGIVYFRKHLDYSRRFLYEISASVLQFGFAVGYALVNPTIWALVIGFLTSSAVKLVMSYVLHGYRPWPEFDLARAKEMMDYGKWMLGSSIMNYIHDSGDDAFVVFFLGPTFLGFYQMAFQISNAPVTEISHVITDVAFPTYSKLQDDIEQLRTAFFHVVQLVTFLATPVSIGIATVAPTFVRAFLGTDWLPMILPMQILALYAVWRAFASTFGAVWKAVGRPDYLTKLQTFSTLLIAVFIYPASEAWGLTGVALTVFGTYMCIMIPIDCYVTVRELDTSILRLFREIAYPIAASTVMAAAVLLTRRALDVQPIVEFFALVVVGVLAYLLGVLVLELRFAWGIRDDIRRIRQAI